VRLVAFHQTAFDDYSDWAKTDKKLFDRIRRIGWIFNNEGQGYRTK